MNRFPYTDTATGQTITSIEQEKKLDSVLESQRIHLIDHPKQYTFGMWYVPTKGYYIFKLFKKGHPKGAYKLIDGDIYNLINLLRPWYEREKGIRHPSRLPGWYNTVYSSIFWCLVGVLITLFCLHK